MDLIHFAIPGFILLITAEVIFSAVEKRDLYETKDAASSIAMGLGNVIIGLFTKAVIYLVYLAAYEFRLFTLDAAVWWVWVLCFFADDLTYYWFHRSSHEIRYFWASHVVHHSSRKYNLSTALRQTWTGNLSGAFLFWIWMPLAGFHPAMVMAMQSVSLLYQFWIHTEAINKLPGLWSLCSIPLPTIVFTIPPRSNTGPQPRRGADYLGPPVRYFPAGGRKAGIWADGEHRDL